MNTSLKLIKLKDVLALCAISKTTLYRLINSEKFPRPLQLPGGRAVAWRYRDIEEWIEKLEATSIIGEKSCR
ncbi:helix-turn-helix transcriptional regulator [Hydrogenovibrio marinus]|uniref:AlpA family transcriptional regulator n=1 Tax=Hydrogenovibrio marinus TaxID=28885 RepID=A0A067A1U4_HYDMR|nr:AlpA family phage regulatory protein [Hydrogenovibrio marinus]KDN96586.1 hypothetical protein EI16_10050 [Hydrogenovibrio marinus]BBN60204.1 hypothetical protein HVMH_1798 [Hydrogenovibrio marinus]